MNLVTSQFKYSILRVSSYPKIISFYVPLLWRIDNHRTNLKVCFLNFRLQLTKQLRKQNSKGMWNKKEKEKRNLWRFIRKKSVIRKMVGDGVKLRVGHHLARILLLNHQHLVTLDSQSLIVCQLVLHWKQIVFILLQKRPRGIVYI